MATTAAEPVFVDTNVLVYAHVAEAPWHQETQAAIADYEGPEVTSRLLALLLEVPTRGRLLHDVNIVATRLVYGVRRLLTNNPEDFVRFAAFIDVLPWVPPPAPAPPPSV